MKIKIITRLCCCIWKEWRLDKTLIIKLLFSTTISQHLTNTCWSSSAVCLVKWVSVVLSKDQLGAKCCRISAAAVGFPFVPRLHLWQRVAMSAIIASPALWSAASVHDVCCSKPNCSSMLCCVVYISYPSKLEMMIVFDKSRRRLLFINQSPVSWIGFSFWEGVDWSRINTVWSSRLMTPSNLCSYRINNLTCFCLFYLICNRSKQILHKQQK